MGGSNIAVSDELREQYIIEPRRMNVLVLCQFLTEMEEIQAERQRLKRKLYSQQLGNILKD